MGHESNYALDGARRAFLKNLAATTLAIPATGAFTVAAHADDGRRSQGDDWPPGGVTRQHNMNCFLTATRIRTSSGWRAIEQLKAGDLVPTRFGGEQPIVRVARYWVDLTEGVSAKDRDARLPVRIARSAFGPNLPRADLYVTGGHALLIGGALVYAERLVNGDTISRCAPANCEKLELFHVELKSHDVIDAEGVACESLLPASVAAAQRCAQACAPNLLETSWPRRAAIYARLFALRTGMAGRARQFAHAVVAAVRGSASGAHELPHAMA